MEMSKNAELCDSVTNRGIDGGFVMLPSVPTTEDKDASRKARLAVNSAVMRGKLQRVTELTCPLCGAQAQFYHHESYARGDYLKVIPLCGSCHRLLHTKSREEFIPARVKALKAELAAYKKHSWSTPIKRQFYVEQAEQQLKRIQCVVTP